MKDKIDEFSISQPLNAARRKALERMIEEHAPRSPWPVAYEWHGTHVLAATTGAVHWQIFFHDHKIEIFARAPFWAKMLLTKKKREDLHDMFEWAVTELGFYEQHPKKAVGKKK